MPGPSIVSKNTINVPKRVTRNSNISKGVVTNIYSKGKLNSVAALKVPHAIGTENDPDIANKRKAEKSPHTEKVVKRSALVNITNKKSAQDAKKTTTIKLKHAEPTVSSRLKVRTAKTSTVTTLTAKQQTSTLQPISKQREKLKITNGKSLVDTKITVEAKEVTAVLPPTIIEKPNEVKASLELEKPQTRRQSLRLSNITSNSGSEDSSLYVSALEDLNITEDNQITQCINSGPPLGVIDFDAENLNDPNQISHYVFDIFNYLKTREVYFQMPDYMHKQKGLNTFMRALLVNWMVEIQENFELTHETLYLAVKIMDKYLSKKSVNKEHLQLVGATSLFISSKFEETSPPVVDDIVYVGDNSYTEQDVFQMEVSILKNLNFELGFPLSYRFLRRFGRCCKTPMPLLTLARYILEFSLMEYETITLSDSKMAAAALHIARLMNDVGGWDSTLEYYSGYKLADFKHIAVQLNDILHKKPKSSLSFIMNKYSHETFFAVAKTPLIENSEL